MRLESWHSGICLPAGPWTLLSEQGPTMDLCKGGEWEIQPKIYVQIQHKQDFRIQNFSKRQNYALNVE